MNNFKDDIIESIKVLNQGGLILYPTDTIWGIGCDATNDLAVEKVYALKQRGNIKSLIVLVAEMQEVYEYVRDVPGNLSEIISNFLLPTTIIYEGGKNVAKAVMTAEGTIAIRIVRDPFCKSLITAFGKAIVSTSANISGNTSPQAFIQIEEEIKNGVDYIVRHRQNELECKQPSSIIKLHGDGDHGNLLIR